MSTFHVLQLRFDDPHLVRVLEQALGTRVATDHPLPTLGERDLAPRPTLGAGQHDVDEGAPAADRAPLARGVLVGRALVLQRLDGVEAAESRRLPAARPTQGAQRGADRARFARERMDHDLRPWNLAGDEVHLRLYY